MPVKGKSVEFVDYGKEVGLFEAKVLTFNPSKEELSKLLGREIEKDPEYLREDQEGYDQVLLTVWVEDVKSKKKFKLVIPITNKDVSNKNGDKTKFINTQGNVTYFIDSEDNLMEWFKAYDYWKAHQGEDVLYNFLKAWLQIDTFHDKSAEMYVDFKKIIKGNVKELRSFIGTENDKTVLLNSIIVTRKITDDQGNEIEKQFQNIYNKQFLPGSAIKFFNLGGKLPKFVQKYVDDCTGEYGIKDFFIMKPLREYDPEENVVTGDQPLVEDDSSY